MARRKSALRQRIEAMVVGDVYEVKDTACRRRQGVGVMLRQIRRNLPEWDGRTVVHKGRLYVVRLPKEAS